VTTVDGNMQLYTKREVQAAQEARQLISRLGHPSSDIAKQMVATSITGTTVTASDIMRAESIYGKSIFAMKGKQTKPASKPAIPTLAPRLVQTQQSLCVDVFFVNSVPFLLGFLSPLGLLMVRELQSRGSIGSQNVHESIRQMIAESKKRNFDITIIQSDGEKSVSTMKDELHNMGIDLDISGPGQHIAQVERKIRVVKERVRVYSSTLPYIMCKILLVWCVYFCVSRLNLQPYSQSLHGASPREQFIGRKISNSLDLRVGFGEYVQATVPITDSSMSPRTDGCITLFPVGNLQGSVRMLSLTSMRIITRDHFQILPMPAYVIEHLNQAASKDSMTRVSTLDQISENNETKDDTVPDVTQLPDVMPVINTPPEDGDIDANNIEDIPRIGEEEIVIPTDHNPPTTPETGWVRRSTRLGAIKIAHAFKISVKEAISQHGIKAISVINLELQQLLDKKVFSPVHINSLSSSEKMNIIRSSMFIKEKFLSTGGFDKLKARLVGGGDQQDRSDYRIDLSSSTAATTSVFIVAAIAASEHRLVVTLDIPAAYLNAWMKKTGVKVHMRINKNLSRMLSDLDHSMVQYLDEKGQLVVRLDKALYGCIESAKLWFDHLSESLASLGFIANKHEPCLYNKTIEQHQVSIIVHVDDLMITSTDQSH
jgi:hypothetical protein